MQNALSTSPTTVVGFMQARQTALGLTDHDLCAAIGLERQIALTMIKTGAMRLPLTKVPAVAAALGLDAAELLRVALRESDPVLLQLIEDTFDHLRLTATEQTLIKHLREFSGDAPRAPIVFEGKPITALVEVSA